MVFRTRKGNTAQKLKMELKWQSGLNYQEVYKRLESARVRFSMVDEATGRYKIANKQAVVESIPLDYGEAGNQKFILVYCFTERDLDEPKQYRGEFTIRFDDCDDVLNVPVAEKLYIIVGDSIGAFDD